MNVVTIRPQELAEVCASGKAIELIDVRTPGEFQAAHLPWARNVPLDQLNPAALDSARQRAAGEPLYVICQSGGRGTRACERLAQAGFTDVVNVAGGTQACIAAGLPVVRGTQTISLERQVRIAAGSLVLLGIALSFFHPAFLALTAIVGAGLVFSGLTDTCGLALVLARLPWNQVGDAKASC